MKSKEKKRSEDPFDELLEKVDAEDIRRLIKRLSSSRKGIKRGCLEFIEANARVTSSEKTNSNTETVFALWMDLEFDLDELYQYGGGDCEMADHVGLLLYDLSQQVRKKRIPRENRRELLELVLPYIRSGNAGLDDELYDLAYATCYGKGDLRHLAQRFEETERDWPIDHARRIYRKIGDREKYLQLRALKMKYGLDYYDLATFFWDSGERDKAVEVAKEGLEKAEGRMDELRLFVAERAKEAGDRGAYLELHFAQATDYLTEGKYRIFKKPCKGKEWERYEPRILAAIKKAGDSEKLKIHMLRGERDHVLRILEKRRYPDTRYGEGDFVSVARKLEKEYPERILSFYMSGLGELDYTMPRKEYALKAEVMKKVHHMWVDVMRTPEKWEAFAGKIKEANSKRPALQEEFAGIIPGWKDL